MTTGLCMRKNVQICSSLYKKIHICSFISHKQTVQHISLAAINESLQRFPKENRTVFGTFWLQDRMFCSRKKFNSYPQICCENSNAHGIDYWNGLNVTVISLLNSIPSLKVRLFFILIEQYLLSLTLKQLLLAFSSEGCNLNLQKVKNLVK